MSKIEPKNETVILLHGIGHMKVNMLATQKILERRGYKTLNLTYPSLRNDIKSLAEWLSIRLGQEDVWRKSDKVHFVVHSMGGLVSGFYLDIYKDTIPNEKMGRVVMLGTPHGGSEVADFLQENPLYKWIFGPAGQELTTAARETQKIMPWYDLGIIAGTQNKKVTLGHLFIDSTHDGVVSVESTKIAGMSDHIEMPVLHSFMAWTPDVQKQVISFLEAGKFEHVRN